MTSKETYKMAICARENLKKTIREDLKKKAMLGQHVIIRHEGRTCRISASEALKIAERNNTP